MSLFNRRKSTEIVVAADATHGPTNQVIIIQWLATKRSAHTRRVYERDIELFLATCGDLPLMRVTLADVLRFKESLTGKAATKARRLSAIKSLLTFCCHTFPEFFPMNVGAAVQPEHVEDALAERILPERAIQMMLTAQWLDEKDSNRLRNYVLLRVLYQAAIRRSELCALQWRHVQARENDNSGQITVYGKGGKTRAVLLTAELWQELLSLRQDATDEMPVFVSRQHGSNGVKALQDAQVYNIVRHAAVRAGIEKKVSPHWLRHAHASHALDNGAPITLVRDTLGHSDLRVTSRYSHARPSASSGQYLKV